jgi:hypothetical protein
VSVFTFCQYCCSGLLETATIPLFLAVTAPHCVWCSNLTAPYRYYNGDDELGVLAQFYHIPWLSGRSLLWSLASECGCLAAGCCLTLHSPSFRWQ